MNEVFQTVIQDPLIEKNLLDIEHKSIDLSNLKLVSSFDPILKEIIPPFTFKLQPVDPIELANVLVKIMKEHNGLGLSANQVGLRIRCFAMVAEPNYVCFNPIIVGHGDDVEKMEEGCLSYKNLYVPIKRWKSIKVRFTMPNGDVTTKVFAGLTARVFQHEFSHLNGIVPLGEASNMEIIRAIDIARKKFKTNYYLKYIRNETKS